MSGSLAVGTSILAAWIAVAIVAPWLAPYPPNEQLDVLGGRLRPPGTVLFAVELENRGWRLCEKANARGATLTLECRGQSEVVPLSQVLNSRPDGSFERRVYRLGSDGVGRDVLSRLLHGARVSLGVALLATALALTIGVAVGAIAALGGRLVDGIAMRAVDALLTIPTLFLLIALAAIFRPNNALVIVVLGATGWMGLARIVRAELLSLKEREFVLAARGLGRSWFAILFDHLLPNARASIVVQATLLASNVILAEAVLSFLGLGIQPPQASWGTMIADGQAVFASTGWLGAIPGVALVSTSIALNLICDGLQDRYDPRIRRTALGST